MTDRITVAHASDTHGRPSLITGVSEHPEVQLIILTGDILQNAGRRRDPETGLSRISHLREIKYQESWGRKQAKKWAKAFSGRDVVYVDGNHDFIDIGRWLLHYGHPPSRLHHITSDNPSAKVFGLTFAGFREVPYMDGEWVGESYDFYNPVMRAFDQNPDILVTHSCPGNILDGRHTYGHIGIGMLTNKLMYDEHNIKYHFFGHEHSQGGQQVTIRDTTYFNGACHMLIHNLEL